jgi:hypothetical protein
MAEAAAKALEHTLLLSLLLPPKNSIPLDPIESTPPPKAGQRGAAGKSAPVQPPVIEPLPAYRYGLTHGYEVLPAARAKAGGAWC